MLDPIRDFPWLRHGYEQGKDEGVTEGMAKSILTLLSGRNIAVDDILRQRILKCQDQEQLGRWLVRAATAQTAVEVVSDN